MKTTIFTRIILATFLPLILIFSLVIFAINKIIYNNGVNFSRELATQTADNASNQIADLLENMASVLNFASQSLTELDHQTPEARERARGILRRLLAADPDFYCAWMAFEPGVFDDSQYHYLSLLKDGGAIRAIDDLSPEILDDLARSPWYGQPLVTGRVYLDLMDSYDFGQPEGPITVTTMTFPILHGQTIIGGVGLDVRYENIVTPAQVGLTGRQVFLLVSDEGLVLASNNPEEVGRKLVDIGGPDLSPVLATMSQGRGLADEHDSPLLGTRAFFSLTPIHIAPAGRTLYLYLDLPADELYGQSLGSIRTIVIISLIGLALIFGGTFLATRRIVRPIKRLTAGYNQIARGDLNLDPGGDPPGGIKTRVIELESLQASLDQMLGQIARAHDLSLKAAEAKIEKERLLAAAEAKNSFFANMSHEIRTPMNAVLGIADILLNDRRLTEDQARYVGDIKVSSQSLLALINDILDLSKLESGRMFLTPANFSFPALLDNLRSLAGGLARDKGLEFIFETDGKIPDYLYGDDVRLRQILVNLLTNAIKFTPAGTVALKVMVTGDFIYFTVSDTGIGIKDEDRSRLFEPFQRIDPTRDRGLRGTGLGLSICKNLAELMNGGLDVESEYGRGSVFTLRLPKIVSETGETDVFAVPPSGADVGPTGPGNSRRSLRALVVDDNEINLHVAAGLLTSFHDIESDLVTSGREALALVTEHDYDYIFMDHMMPEMDGVEATRRIRALGGKYRSVPIIAFTANVVGDARDKLLASGMNDFLAKPIMQGDLEAVLRKWAPAPEAAPAEAQTVDDPNSIIRRAANIEELDPAAGLDAVAAQEAVYERSLKLLNERLPLISGQFLDLMAREDWPGLAGEIKGLKALLSGGGALELAEQARILETAALDQNRDYCRDFLPGFITRLEALSGKLAELFNAPRA